MSDNCKGCGAPLESKFVCGYCGAVTGKQAQSEEDEIAMLRECSRAAIAIGEQQKKREVPRAMGIPQVQWSDVWAEEAMATFWSTAPLPRTQVALKQACVEALTAYTGKTDGNFAVVASQQALWQRAKSIMTLLEAMDTSAGDLSGVKQLFQQKKNQIEEKKNARRRLWKAFGFVTLATLLSLLVYTRNENHRVSQELELEGRRSLGSGVSRIQSIRHENTSAQHREGNTPPVTLPPTLQAFAQNFRGTYSVDLQSCEGCSREYRRAFRASRCFVTFTPSDNSGSQGRVVRDGCEYVQGAFGTGFGPRINEAPAWTNYQFEPMAGSEDRIVLRFSNAATLENPANRIVFEIRSQSLESVRGGETLLAGDCSWRRCDRRTVRLAKTLVDR
jgi:hypothetical protein